MRTSKLAKRHHASLRFRSDVRGEKKRTGEGIRDGERNKEEKT